MPETIYLSIVATAAKTDRDQAFVDRLLEQARRYQLSCEIIVVNAAERLRNARRVESSAASELGARNAGIRRALGEFVLSTRIDASFPDRLIEFLAARPLERGRLYRMDRREESGAASGAGIRFGIGWYPLQQDESGAFRWMENDAELILDTQPGGGILRIELEPGPGLGASPQPLQVIDSSGAQLAEWSIAGRDTVRIHIPPSTNGPQRIRLRTPTGGRPVIDDPRILNLRILRCEWVETGGELTQPAVSLLLAERHTLMRLLGAHRSGGVGLVQKAVRLLGMRGDDVFDAMCEFEAGVGWHYLEREGNAKFRWTEPKSELHVCFDDGSTHLAMLVEPGPSIGYRAFDLAVRMPDGKMAGNVHIAGLTYVEIPLPVPPGIAAKVQFEVEGAASSSPAAGDSRALAYRVFACGRGPFRNPKARTDPARNAWIAHTIRTRPPATDWQKKLAAQEKEITEMGRPAYLRTANCGDFQLMAREHWYDLRGYTEFARPAENIDALLAYQAYHLGLREQRLAVGDGLCIEASGARKQAASDYFNEKDLADLIAQMRVLHAPLIFNGANWGAADALEPAAHEPYISVVVAARNDNHGGNMLVRMQAFLDSWIGQAQRFNLPSEMIIVEWNPPQDRPKLKDALRWPATTAPCTVRFIECPPELHRSIPNASSIPLHQMIAKNVGIRRARGKFVLATNLDIVFSTELMEFLAARPLDGNAMYRMDRFDVDNHIPPGADLDELVEFCKTHIIRVLAHEGAYSTDGGNILPIEPADIVNPGSGLRLGRGWYTVEQYPDSPVMRFFNPGALVHFERPDGARQILFDVESGPSAQDGWCELEVLDAKGAVVATAKLDGRHQVRLTLPPDPQRGVFGLRVNHAGMALAVDIRILDLRVFSIAWEDTVARAFSLPCPDSSGHSLDEAARAEECPDESGHGRLKARATEEWRLEVLTSALAKNWVNGVFAQSAYAKQMRAAKYLHTNACGDFTMLSREAWFALRGYAEFAVWPTHLDSVLCYAAYHAGLREVVIPDPIRVFHIDHAQVWTPDSEEERGTRAEKLGVHLITFKTLIKYFTYMRRFNLPMIFTKDDWGLRDVELPETTL